MKKLILLAVVLFAGNAFALNEKLDEKLVCKGKGLVDGIREISLVKGPGVSACGAYKMVTESGVFLQIIPVCTEVSPMNGEMVLVSRTLSAGVAKISLRLGMDQKYQLVKTLICDAKHLDLCAPQKELKMAEEVMSCQFSKLKI